MNGYWVAISLIHYGEMEMRPWDIGVDHLDRLWGIPVTLDRHDKFRISLLKEIK